MLEYNGLQLSLRECKHAHSLCDNCLQVLHEHKIFSFLFHNEPDRCVTTTGAVKPQARERLEHELGVSGNLS